MSQAEARAWDFAQNLANHKKIQARTINRPAETTHTHPSGLSILRKNNHWYKWNGNAWVFAFFSDVFISKITELGVADELKEANKKIAQLEKELEEAIKSVLDALGTVTEHCLAKQKHEWRSSARRKITEPGA